VLVDEALALPALASAGPVVVDGAPAGDDYRVDVRIGGTSLPTVTVFDAGAVQQAVHVEVPAVALAGAVHVRVAYRDDPAALVCAVQVGAQCLARLPADPRAPDLQALPAAALVVRADGAAAGQPVRLDLVVPLVGQAAGAALG
jgi:hypothetical protein